MHVSLIKYYLGKLYSTIYKSSKIIVQQSENFGQPIGMRYLQHVNDTQSPIDSIENKLTIRVREWPLVVDQFSIQLAEAAIAY